MARFRDHRVFSECMWHRRALRLQCLAKNAPVAQLDRALDYESRGQEFESLRARHLRTKLRTPFLPDCELAITACSRVAFEPWMRITRSRCNCEHLRLMAPCRKNAYRFAHGAEILGRAV